MAIHTDNSHSQLRRKIFTLGTDRRSEEDFVEILLAYDIQMIIDVRSIPRSRIPIFDSQNLKMLLERERIQYYFMGKELGGFRRGGYTSYIITEQFLEGIDMLERFASRALSALICAEKLPWKCHRKWIAKELQKRGWLVTHIIDKGKLWIPK